MEEKKDAKRRTAEEIGAEIAKVKEEMENAQGTECEVYARIVGYYRSVKNWNRGKREEYGERRMFMQDNPRTAAELQTAEAGA